MDMSTSAGAGVRHHSAPAAYRRRHHLGGRGPADVAVYRARRRETGAEGRGFLRQLYGGTGLPRLIPLSAFITTVAGLLLYGALSYHEAMNSSMGVVLTLGALFGCWPLRMAGFAVWRGAGQYVDLLPRG